MTRRGATAQPRKITLRQAEHAVQLYNRSMYARVRRLNTEVDADMYSRFANGLAPTVKGIEEQLQFIGDQYGGVSGFPSALQLAPKIARRIDKDRDRIISLVTGVSSLFDGAPSRACVDELYPYFVEPLHGKKNWQTWASKFWHALNPEAFPIEDSRADRFLGLSGKANSPAKQEQFFSEFRAFALWFESQGWLPRLRTIDQHQSWSDLKLIDKVLYTHGHDSGCK